VIPAPANHDTIKVSVFYVVKSEIIYVCCQLLSIYWCSALFVNESDVENVY